MLGADDDADWLAYSDPSAGDYRAAWLVKDRLEACFHLSARPDLPGTEWLAGCFTSEAFGRSERAALLAGAPRARAAAGPTICACCGVGRQTILDAIRDGGLDSEAAVTQQVRAGGNCGSCLPEIRALPAEVAG